MSPRFWWTLRAVLPVADDGWRVAGRVAATSSSSLSASAARSEFPLAGSPWGARSSPPSIISWTATAGRPGQHSRELRAWRLALPYVERQAMGYPLRLVALVGISAALIPLLDPVLEYGSEGWRYGHSSACRMDRSLSGRVTAAALREYALAGVAAGRTP